MKLIAVIFLLLVVIAGKPFSRINTVRPVSVHYFSIDTSKYSILKFTLADSSLFNNDAKPAQLTDKEIEKIEKLIKIKASEYNKDSKYSKYSQIRNPSKYYKQLIAVTNANGEKVVWVNCLCSIENDKSDFKKDIITVLDGGDCYFNLKINLTKNTAYDLMVMNN